MGILNDLKNYLTAYRLKFFSFNTETERLDNFDKIEFGGGTEFAKFHHEDDSDVVIIITDCEFSFDFLKSHNRKKVILINVYDDSIEDILN